MEKSQNRKTRIFFDMHLPEWNDKKVASGFDVDLIARTFAESGVDSVVAFAKCQYGNFYCNTRTGHKHEGLGEHDFLRSLTRKLHEKNIEVLAYYSVAWDEREAHEHPEWLTEDSGGGRDSAQFRWKTLCINSPYRGTVKKQLAEIAGETEVDGFWLDMTIIGQDRCFCPHCDELFKSRYGNSMRESLDAGGGEKLLEFRFDYIEEFYKEIYGMLREINPRLVIANNYWGYPYQPKNMGSRAIGALREADFISGEAYTDWTGLEAPSIFSRFLGGAAKRRPFEALVGRFINTWDYSRKSFDQMFFECMTVFSFGGTVTVDDEPYYDGGIDIPLYRSVIAPIFRTIHDWDHTVQGERFRYAAIFHSQETKNHTAREEDFIRDVAGTYKQFRERHLPVDFVFDENITDKELSAYKVVLLPSVAFMGEKAFSALRGYAASGGVIVGFGRNIFFETLFKDRIEYRGEAEYSLSYYPSESGPLLVRGAYSRYMPTAPSEIRGKAIINPIAETTGNVFFHNNLPSPHAESDCSASYVMPCGKGWIIQYNQPIARSYAKQQNTGLRDEILETIAAHAGPSPVQAEAPGRVDMAVYTDAARNRLYIHLMAYGAESSLACGILDTMEGNFDRPYVSMERRDPVSDLELAVTVKVSVHSVTSLYEKNTLRWDTKEDRLNIHLDRLSLWDVLEVQYA
jgi:hypothetical protein